MKIVYLGQHYYDLCDELHKAIAAKDPLELETVIEDFEDIDTSEIEPDINKELVAARKLLKKLNSKESIFILMHILYLDFETINNSFLECSHYQNRFANI